MTVILPNLVPAQVVGACLTRYYGILTSQWVPLGLATAAAGVLHGMFLGACRHLALHRPEYIRQTVLYKLACLQAVKDAISAGESTLSCATVATVMLLAYDEVRQHNGGPDGPTQQRAA